MWWKPGSGLPSSQSKATNRARSIYAKSRRHAARYAKSRRHAAPSVVVMLLACRRHAAHTFIEHDF